MVLHLFLKVATFREALFLVILRDSVGSWIIWFQIKPPRHSSGEEFFRDPCPDIIADRRAVQRNVEPVVMCTLLSPGAGLIEGDCVARFEGDRLY